MMNRTRIDDSNEDMTEAEVVPIQMEMEEDDNDLMIRLNQLLSKTSEHKDIMTHIARPGYLPSKEKPELQKHEDALIAVMADIIELFEDILPKDAHCLKSEINGLKGGEMLGIFVRHQNCGFVVYIPRENDLSMEPKYAIVSTFPVSVPANEIYNKENSDLQLIMGPRATQINIPSSYRYGSVKFISPNCSEKHKKKEENHELIEHKKAVIRKTQKAKYKTWKVAQHKGRRGKHEHGLKPKLLEGFVVNLSSVILKDEEMVLLNKGLNFILPPETPPVEDICVDVMSPVRYRSAAIKNDTKINTLNIIRDAVESHTPNVSVVKLTKVIKSLKEKKLIITKADKSNNVIVMDSTYYERVIMKTICDGPYVELSSDPLSDMVDEVEAVLEKHKFTVCKNPVKELRTWKVSNPQVPCLYGLLKLHKQVDDDGDYKARPVACNTNAPSEAMAKSLSAIFNGLPPPVTLCKTFELLVAIIAHEMCHVLVNNLNRNIFDNKHGPKYQNFEHKFENCILR